MTTQIPDPADGLENLLRIETSRRSSDLLVDLVGQRPELFERLVAIYLSLKEPESRRAAWVVDIISEANPGIADKYVPDIIRLLPEFNHDGLKRHSLRILSHTPLPPEELLGQLITICFDWLVSAREAVAVKVYAMDLLYRISAYEPDIRKELADSIEWRMNEETNGFKAHGRKVLKKLHQSFT